MIHGASKESYKYFKKEQFHCIVGDLPYGIKHEIKVVRSIKMNSKSRRISLGMFT